MVDVNKTIKILLLFLFVLNLSESLFGPLFALYVRGYVGGATIASVGIAVALYSIAKSLVQVPLARMLDRSGNERGEYYAMILGALISVVYALGLTFISSVEELYFLAALNGVGGAFLMAAYYGMFSHHVDRKLQSYEWSLFSVGGLTISVAIGAALGGILAERIGFTALLFIVAGLNTAAVALLIALLPLHHKK